MYTNTPRIEPIGKKLNLQLFAEPTNNTSIQFTATTPEPATAPNAEPAQTEPNTSQQTFTLDEVMKMIQSETDKRVTQALKKQEKDFKKQMSLSGLDEQQRAIAERDNKIAEQDELIRSLTIDRNKSELVKTLAARGLPVEFADVIDVGDDAEAAQAKVDALDTVFKRAIEAAVNQRLAGGGLPGRGTTKGAAMTKEQILAIKDHVQRQNAIRDNIELFR